MAGSVSRHVPEDIGQALQGGFAIAIEEEGAEDAERKLSDAAAQRRSDPEQPLNGGAQHLPSLVGELPVGGKLPPAFGQSRSDERDLRKEIGRREATLDGGAQPITQRCDVFRHRRADHREGPEQNQRQQHCHQRCRERVPSAQVLSAPGESRPRRNRQDDTPQQRRQERPRNHERCGA